MRRYGWLTLGLVLALAFTNAATKAPAAEVAALGAGPAYDAIGRLPIQHAGRLKPFDTFARQTLKQFYQYDVKRWLTGDFDERAAS